MLILASTTLPEEALPPQLLSIFHTAQPPAAGPLHSRAASPSPETPLPPGRTLPWVPADTTAVAEACRRLASAAVATQLLPALHQLLLDAATGSDTAHGTPLVLGSGAAEPAAASGARQQGAGAAGRGRARVHAHPQCEPAGGPPGPGQGVGTAAGRGAGWAAEDTAAQVALRQQHLQQEQVGAELILLLIVYT